MNIIRFGGFALHGILQPELLLKLFDILKDFKTLTQCHECFSL